MSRNYFKLKSKTKDTATLIKVNGNQALFKLSKPIRWADYQPEGVKWRQCSYLISSKGMGFYETYLFPANKAGEIVSYSELDGSEKDIYDFIKPLKNRGLKVIIPKAYKVLFENV